MLEKKFGFTLIEVILVLTTVSILAAISIGTYRSLIKKTEVDSAASNIIFNLKRTKANALSGADDRRWGIHFVNSSTSTDYYVVFSTPTDYPDAGVILEDTVYLPNSVYFTDPSDASSTKDIIFEKIRGTLSSDGTVGISSVDNFSRSIIVNQIGSIR